MSLQPTQREAATGGLDPFQIQASTDYGALLEDGTVIDGAGPGWTSVRHVAGRAPQPRDRLHGDPTATIYGPLQPPVIVEIRYGEKPSPAIPDALTRALDLVEKAKNRATS